MCRVQVTDAMKKQLQVTAQIEAAARQVLKKHQEIQKYFQKAVPGTTSLFKSNTGWFTDWGSMQSLDQVAPRPANPYDQVGAPAMQGSMTRSQHMRKESVGTQELVQTSAEEKADPKTDSLYKEFGSAAEDILSQIKQGSGQANKEVPAQKPVVGVEVVDGPTGFWKLSKTKGKNVFAVRMQELVQTAEEKAHPETQVLGVQDSEAAMLGDEIAGEALSTEDQPLQQVLASDEDEKKLAAHRLSIKALESMLKRTKEAEKKTKHRMLVKAITKEVMTQIYTGLQQKQPSDLALVYLTGTLAKAPIPSTEQLFQSNRAQEHSLHDEIAQLSEQGAMQQPQPDSVLSEELYTQDVTTANSRIHSGRIARRALRLV